MRGQLSFSLDLSARTRLQPTPVPAAALFDKEQFTRIKHHHATRSLAQPPLHRGPHDRPQKGTSSKPAGPNIEVGEALQAAAAYAAEQTPSLFHNTRHTKQRPHRRATQHSTTQQQLRQSSLLLRCTPRVSVS